MLKPSMEVNNCYILQSKIGETLFFDLWTAMAIYSPNRFLLRFIKPSILSKEVENQLRAEALQDYRLIHSGIDTVVEADFFEDRLFISSEYQDQVLLRDFPKTKINTEIVWVEKLVLHLAKALEFFHAHGLLYGVFLPESVLVARYGNSPEDFSLFKPGYRTILSTLVTKKNAVSSYQSFLAPELLFSGIPSIASDLYSFGKLMDFILVSVVLPPAFDRIIKTCTQIEPRDRYPNASTLIKEIETLLKASAPEAFFILPSTGGPEESKQKASLSSSQPPAVRSVSQVRTEVLNYFQELSANYRFEHGYTEKTASHSSSSTAVSSSPRSSPIAQAWPKTVPPQSSGTSSVQDDYYSRWSQLASPSPALPTAALPPSAVSSLVTVPPAVTVAEKVSEGVSGGTTVEPVRWQYHCVNLEAIEKTLIRTFMRSKKGIGDFRFIQEPEDSESQGRLNRVLQSLAQEAFFIDGGSLCGAQEADVKSFFYTIQRALELPLSQETLRSRRRFGSLIDTAGARRFFSTGTIGDLLFGDRKSEEGPPETFGNDRYDVLIEALTCFARKKKPQVIVIRGSECIGSELSEYLIEFARKIRHKSVCIFIFGREFPAEFRRFRSETE